MNSVTCQASASRHRPRTATKESAAIGRQGSASGAHSTHTSAAGTAQTASARAQPPPIACSIGTVNAAPAAAPAQTAIV